MKDQPSCTTPGHLTDEDLGLTPAIRSEAKAPFGRFKAHRIAA
jgi:hypothetical protein